MNFPQPPQLGMDELSMIHYGEKQRTRPNLILESLPLGLLAFVVWGLPRALSLLAQVLASFASLADGLRAVQDSFLGYPCGHVLP